MKIEHGTMKVMKFRPERLDPVTVVYTDTRGEGLVIIQCWGEAWTRYFADIGAKGMIEFLAGCDVDYLASAIAPPQSLPARAAAYRRRVCEAVIAACKQIVNSGGSHA